MLGLLACFMLAPAAAAAAAPGAEGTPTPSAKELWNEYPLHPEPDGVARSTPSARPRVTEEPARSASDGGNLLSPLAVAVVLAMIALALLWTLRPREGGEPDEGAVDKPGHATGGRPKERSLLRSYAAPPDPSSAWSAEVEWGPTQDQAHFVAVARSAGGEQAVVVAQSPALRWPPADQAAVRALGDAVLSLERSLLAAGWASRAAGPEWYAKRFAWEPRPAVPSPLSNGKPEPTGRFQRHRGWPFGSVLLWRCEVHWKPGLVNSRFEAVAYRPAGRGRRTVGGSATFKWRMLAEPDPKSADHREELARLTARLAAAGWEDIGRGATWYSERFLWRREGAPPASVDPVTSETTATE